MSADDGWRPRDGVREAAAAAESVELILHRLED